MSSLALDNSSIRCCNAALTVADSSLSDCSSSLVGYSSSLVLCSSSLVDFSSSIAGCRFSLVYCNSSSSLLTSSLFFFLPCRTALPGHVSPGEDISSKVTVRKPDIPDCTSEVCLTTRFIFMGPPLFLTCSFSRTVSRWPVAIFRRARPNPPYAGSCHFQDIAAGYALGWLEKTADPVMEIDNVGLPVYVDAGRQIALGEKRFYQVQGVNPLHLAERVGAEFLLPGFLRWPTGPGKRGPSFPHLPWLYV